MARDDQTWIIHHRVISSATIPRNREKTGGRKNSIRNSINGRVHGKSTKLKERVGPARIDWTREKNDESYIVRQLRRGKISSENQQWRKTDVIEFMKLVPRATRCHVRLYPPLLFSSLDTFYSLSLCSLSSFFPLLTGYLSL